MVQIYACVFTYACKLAITAEVGDCIYYAVTVTVEEMRLNHIRGPLEGMASIVCVGSCFERSIPLRTGLTL